MTVETNYTEYIGIHEIMIEVSLFDYLSVASHSVYFNVEIIESTAETSEGLVEDDPDEPYFAENTKFDIRGSNIYVSNKGSFESTWSPTSAKE